ncbi:MAG: ABC transporter permease [Lachnospiraceae bacterium]|nr:ABC transporter permease [Lachnospiraceae bacterium]
MFRYIYTEFFKTIRSKYSIKFILAIVATFVLANLAMIAFRDYVYGTNDGTYGYNIIMFAGGFFWMPYYVTIFISDMVFGETYPDPFIKDRITKRLRRPHLYIGKLLTTFLMLIFYVAFAFIAFIGISTLFQLSTGTLSGAVVKDFAVNVMCAVPLLAAGCSLGMMALFCFERKLWAFVTFWVITIVVPRIVMLLGAEPISIALFKTIKDKVLLTPQFTTLQFFASRDVPQILISSAVYIIVSTLIGGYVFCRKRIDNLPADAGNSYKKRK